MVGRKEKRSKYERWALYLPSGPRLKRWERCLRETVEAGYAKVRMEEVSGIRVDLVLLGHQEGFLLSHSGGATPDRCGISRVGTSEEATPLATFDDQTARR